MRLMFTAFSINSMDITISTAEPAGRRREGRQAPPRLYLCQLWSTANHGEPAPVGPGAKRVLEEGKSSRRKIVDSFEINLNRCILCGICVEVCNFDAIVMTHEHEMSTFSRNGDRVDLPVLLEIGHKFQKETGWIPPTKRAKAPKDGEAESEAAPAGTESQ